MDEMSNVVSLCLEPVPMTLHFSDAQMAYRSLQMLDMASHLSRAILDRSAERGDEAAALRDVRTLFEGAAICLEQLADGTLPSRAEALVDMGVEPAEAHRLQQLADDGTPPSLDEIFAACKRAEPAELD